MIFKASISSGRFSFPWHKSIIKVKDHLTSHLFTFNPAMQKIFYDFNLRYKNFRMIDLDLLKQKMPLTINDFKKITSEQVQLKKEFLNKVWLIECAEIIKENQESIENLATQNEMVKNLI